ncbi:stage III sporulation protein AF [Schinkia azotoformans]|uniref:Stage III sporulation protein AF n=1 Tax=Schinkia azotoformans LMG 9581 TaxID=1131731 RepID=K6BYR0_SCHAZ|nr:stage III sporulation protein AF [Schinkia azotoformans]EKN64035.1 stage III sporulation protein AF [Schinkia azotoformans LMG 9581]MEC1640532.1 stage III sporulation protein AF [Schinkia azotoformans]MEC1719453.1 stage III sporulation protein AF [Schinkia azotoformans]MEC1944583.1 stage III sporulation protein AF [Schinkia azotoformans]MED4354720.1 stage III sporulation protein AF [Schinkia azotoformans]
MQFLTTWVSNIVLFVLLAIIIDLLMPNSSLQRYAKMVIGLLLIVIILNPVLKIFNSNIEDILKTFRLPTVEEKLEVENLIENKKKEIQASQRAYILEQMAVQMKTMVEGELMKDYGLKVEAVQLQFSEDEGPLSEEDLKAVKVIVHKENSNGDNESIPTVKDIAIDTTTPFIKKEKNDLSAVEQFLAKNWQLEQSKVDVVMEGGEM